MSVSPLASWREALEAHQVSIYLAALMAGAATGWAWPGGVSSALINPAIGAMLYLTFLQLPLPQLRQDLRHRRFLAALGLANFVLLPMLVWGLLLLLPSAHPQIELLRLGVLLVLLAPCVDYVVTFAHLGRADARLLLAATPVLLAAQMLLLPLYLSWMLDAGAAVRVASGPFVQAFVWLIAVPLLLALLTQWGRPRHATLRRWTAPLDLLPVPATALLLWVVLASQLPTLLHTPAAASAVVAVLPLYALFALLAPGLGWWVGRAWGLSAPAGRALAFSTGTRNALVILPLALAVPGGGALLAAVVLAQTCVELLAELVYVRVIARWGAKHAPTPQR